MALDLPGTDAVLITIIDWRDSTVQNGQVDKHDFPEPTVIRSVGFIVKETDEYIVLARDDMNNGDYRGLCAIPKVLIKLRTES